MRCPLCAGLLRRIAVVETKAEILATLAPLGRDRPHARLFALGPPQSESDVLIDAASGAAHSLDSPAWPPGLSPCLPAGKYPKTRAEPIRFRAEVMAPGRTSTRPASSCRLRRTSRPGAIGQGGLFADDYAQPDLSAPVCVQRTGRCTAQPDAAESN
ncbi:MAG: hypothetical protein HY736_03665 [Verrucomicrobia bacterium]|nr:hypothetical protein [Verrucomicrobiota bacterium]